MKRISLGLLICFSSAVPCARAAEVRCDTKVNLDSVSSEKMVVLPGESVKFGKLENFHFKLHNKGTGRFEIESIDRNRPARSYTEGKLRQAGDDLKWTFWSRKILLEAVCSASSVDQ